MARATAADVRAHPDEYLELVQRGGKITIVEGEEVIGELVPTDDASRGMFELIKRLPDEEATALEPLLSDQPASHTRIQHALEVLRGASAIRASIPASFFSRTRPRFASGSVLEALLEERRDSRR
jgi:antitoxin (DNA-binding transcriptional repressor) of toxin-antitoxin stability system